MASKIKLDLHDIYNKGHLIDKELNEHVDYCVENRIKTLEIIPGKGSGQLKKKVIRFLEQKHIKNKYHRFEKDGKTGDDYSFTLSSRIPDENCSASKSIRVDGRLNPECSVSGNSGPEQS